MKRRWPKRLAWGALAAVLVLLLAVVGLWLWLSSERGEAWALARLLERVNADIAGTLEAGALDVEGGALALADVVLRTPEGEVVLRVERLEADVVRAALLRREVALERLRLYRPELHLVQGEEASNLQRALAPREPQAAPDAPAQADASEKADGGRPLLKALRVDALRVEEGRFTLRPSPEAPQPTLRLTGLEAEGEALLQTQTQQLEAALRATGRLRAPVEAPVQLSLSARGTGGTYDAQVALEAAEARLSAQARMGEEATRVRLERLRLPPELARAALPSWPLVAPLALEGQLTQQGNDIQGELRASAASARVEVSGHFDTETLRSRGLEARLSSVNLAELVKEGQPSDLSLELVARGGGESLETLSGELRVTAPRSPIADTTLGPVVLEARADNGQYTLEKLELNLPGASLSAEGGGSAEDIQVKGRLEATDLAKLSRTVGQLAEPERLPVDGRGQATFRLEGPLRNPNLFLEGRFPRLRYQQQTLRGVKVDLEIPGLIDWLTQEEAEEQEKSGAMPAGMPRVRYTQLRQPRVPTARPRPSRALRSARPLRPGPASAPGAPMLAQAQEAPPEEEQERGRIRLKVEVEDIGLEELLRRLGLDISMEGITRANVKLSGSPEDPRLDAVVELRQVLVPEQPPVDFAVRARTRGDGQVTLELYARAGDAVSELTAHLPFTLARLMKERPSPEELRRAPVTVQGELRDFPLPLTLLGLELEPEQQQVLGKAPVVSGEVKLEGSLMNPRGTVQLRVTGLEAEGTEPLALRARLELEPEVTRVEARVRRQEEALLETRLRFDAPLARLLNEEERGEVALSGEVTLGPTQAERLLPLALVTGQVRDVAGEVRGELKLAGRVDAPRVEGTLEWAQGVLELVGYGTYRDVNLVVRGQQDRLEVERLELRAASGRGQLTGTVERQEGERYAFNGRALLEDFPVVTQDTLRANVSLEATAQGTASAEEIVVEPLKVTRARVELPSERGKELLELDPPENVTFVRNGVPVEPPAEEAPAQAQGEEAPAPQRDGPRVRMRVEAPRNVRVVGDDLDVEVGLSEGFRVLLEDEEPEAFGQVRVRRGVLRFLGNRFEASEDAQVSFNGPVREPRVDAAAVYENRREEVTVTLRVEGTPGELTVETTSTPPLTEAEIATLLVTGRTTLRPGEGGGGPGLNAGQAVSALGGLLARKLERSLGRALPVDYLEIEAGDEGLGGTRLRAGTFVGERLFLGLETQLGADVLRGQNRNELNVEYLLSRRLLVELQYGDARVGSLELRWRRRY